MSCRVGCRRNGAAHLGCVTVLHAPLALIVCGAPEVLQEAVLLLAHHEGVRPVQVVEEVDQLPEARSTLVTRRHSSYESGWRKWRR